MCGYRLYFLDRDDHIHSAINLDCADDDQAVALAHEHHDGAPMELWQGARLVKRIEDPGMREAG
jgi:hypothetical protein